MSREGRELMARWVSQYTYQIALNGSRLGFYEPLRQQINKLAGYSSTDVVAWTSIGAGASSGIVGGTLLPRPAP